jgi:H+/Cl- antiporter ClcA
MNAESTNGVELTLRGPGKNQEVLGNDCYSTESKKIVIANDAPIDDAHHHSGFFDDWYQWLVVVVIAMVIGVIEFMPAAVLAAALPGKLGLLDRTIRKHGFMAMLFTNIGICLGCTAIAAALVVLVAPMSAGSGIPPLIAYLSSGYMGDHSLLSPMTVAVKMIGIVLVITGGLVLGREGPAIHIGAGIADISHRFCNWATTKYTGKVIPFDGYMKHNIVMMGAAAGFSSAFRAPIGGMMYCTEEIATHWDIKEHMNIGCQTFVVVALSAFVTNSMVRASADSGTISFSSIVIFDDSEDALAGVLWKYDDIPGFVAAAILCGIIGGINSRLAQMMAKWRSAQEWLKPWYMQIADACFVAVVTAIVLSSVGLLYPHCNDLPADGRRLAGGGSRRYVQFTCDDGKYCQLASLSLSGEEGVIRHLMSRDSYDLGLTQMTIFIFFYIPVMIMVFGMKVPCGSFVPNLLLGSLIGRIVGEVVENIAGYSLEHVSPPGIYALIGAASMLGAWTRTMIAVVVTLIEISGDVGMAKPLICCTIIARQISIGISHHSFTHELFYSIVDKLEQTDGVHQLHPSDWTDHQDKVKRDIDYHVHVDADIVDENGVQGVRRGSVNRKRSVTVPDMNQEELSTDNSNQGLVSNPKEEA